MKHYFWILCLFILPMTSHAQVLISEVAWMGTDADANNEWIELYNLNNTETDLTGWTISDGASVSIALSGTLSSHGVGVLERTDDDTLPDAAFLIYTGALSNDGGTLTLLDAGGAVSDQAVGGAGWAGIGGRNTPAPKMTAQRTRMGAWVTALPTPGADNAQENATTTEETTGTTTTQTVTTTTRSGGGSSSTVKKVVPAVEEVFSLSISAPRIAYVNQEVGFEAFPKGVGKTFMNSLSYTWNFGDTYTATGKKNTHIFEYPGEYIVVAESAFAKQKTQARHEITVLPMTLSISRTENGDVVLKNNSKQEVDLGGFTLQGMSTLVFPKLTLLKAGGTLTISAKRITVQKESAVALYDVLGTAVVQSGMAPVLKRVALTNNSVFSKRTVDIQPETVPETMEVKKDEITYIPIGQQLAVNDEASEGLLKKFFSRVFGWIGR